MQTRDELLFTFNSLLGAGSGLVTKAAHIGAINKLIDSCTNRVSDSWQSPVKSASNTPPSSGFFNLDDRFIVGPSPTGDWSGKAHHIATATDGGWTFTKPKDGSMIFRTNEPWVFSIMVSGQMHTVRLPTDSLQKITGSSSVSSTALADITGLSAPVLGSRRYRVECVLMVQCGSTTHGLQVGLDGPACTALAITARVPQGATAEVVGHKSQYGAVATSTGFPEENMPVQVTLTATLWNTTEPGWVTPQVATNDGSAPITLLPGSTLSLIDITD